MKQLPPRKDLYWDDIFEIQKGVVARDPIAMKRMGELFDYHHPETPWFTDYDGSHHALIHEAYLYLEQLYRGKRRHTP